MSSKSRAISVSECPPTQTNAEHPTNDRQKMHSFSMKEEELSSTTALQLPCMFKPLDRDEKGYYKTTKFTAPANGMPLVKRNDAFLGDCFTLDGDVGLDSNSSTITPNKNEDTGDALIFHEHGPVGSLIEKLEESLDINKSGIGSVIYYDEIFYDCDEIESEEVECDIENSIASLTEEKAIEAVALRNDCAEEIGLTFHDNAELEEVWDQGKTLPISPEVIARADVKGMEFSTNVDLPTESMQMKAEQIEAFFFNNGMTVALGGLFLSMNVIVAAHAAYQYTASGGFHTDNDILRVTLPIARMGGRLVTFNCAWLLLTGCKFTWTWIRTHMVPIIPIGFPIDDIMPKYHRFVALWVIVSGCIVHSLPQLVNYLTGALKIDDGSKIWTFGDGLATRQLLITGCLLAVIFTLFFLTTLKAFRATATGFRWFKVVHMGGIALAYPLLILHGTFKGYPIFLYVAWAPLMLYIFDVTMRQSKVTNAKIWEWKTHSGGGQRIVELILECPPNFVYTPGQYAELKFDPISGNEWHPFTIASAPSNGFRIYDGKRVSVLIFFIKANGRWTDALFNYASAFDLEKATRGMKLSIRGPHGAPAMNFFEYKHIIVIGSGIGVTPLLSVWQYMVDEGRPKIQEDKLSMPLSKFLSQNSLFDLDNAATVKTAANDGSSVDDASFSSASSLRLAETIFDSLTVSISLYIFFLTGETILAVSQIFGRYAEVAALEMFFSSVSLIFYASTMIVSACVHNKGRGFKTTIEFCIILVDIANLWMSLSVAKHLDEPELAGNSTTRWIVGLGGVTIILTAVRIFHIFYTTLKPKTKKRQQQNRVCSMQGIFVDRSYSEMRFCLEQLLQPIEEGLSKVFSLQFYGTREKRDESSSFPSPAFSVPESLSTGTFQNDCFDFHTGRPDWESIFWKAVRKAQESDPNGESVGVFFCGSPAIAKCLRSTADQVNAEHQYATKRVSGKTSHCSKIVIHVENF